MRHRAEVRTVVGYLVIVALIFLTAYIVLGVREMDIYVVLMLLNLPASVAVMPYMESFAQVQGWELGRPLHVWTTQTACMVVNGVLVAALAVVVIRTWRFLRGQRGAV
jgi:predicted permease